MNSATSASTLRLTRYARDRLDTRVVAASALCSATPGGSCSVRATSSSRAPGASCRSMRVRVPSRSSRHCANAMSIAPITCPSRARGRRPAMRSVCTCAPACTAMLSPGASCRAVSAAADRYRPSSSRPKRRSSPAPDALTSSPTHAGVSRAARRMSTPTTESVRPRSRAGSTSGTSSSSMGLASATRSSAATRPNTSSLNPSRGPTMVASACPVTCRTAEENSASAEALIRCTA